MATPLVPPSLPAGMVHGTYNVGHGVLDFLAILSPAKSPEPITADDSGLEPWKSLRAAGGSRE